MVISVNYGENKVVKIIVIVIILNKVGMILNIKKCIKNLRLFVLCFILWLILFVCLLRWKVSFKLCKCLNIFKLIWCIVCFVIWLNNVLCILLKNILVKCSKL